MRHGEAVDSFRPKCNNMHSTNTHPGCALMLFLVWSFDGAFWRGGLLGARVVVYAVGGDFAGSGVWQSVSSFAACIQLATAIAASGHCTRRWQVTSDSHLPWLGVSF